MILTIPYPNIDPVFSEIRFKFRPDCFNTDCAPDWTPALPASLDPRIDPQHPQLTFDIQNVQGIWTARRLEMTDLRRGSRTRLTLDRLEYNVPMKEEDFTLQAIRRP